MSDDLDKTSGLSEDSRDSRTSPASPANSGEFETIVTVGEVQTAVYRALEQLGLDAALCAVGAGAATRAIEDPQTDFQMAREHDRHRVARQRAVKRSAS